MKQTTVLYRTYETALSARKSYADAVVSGRGIDRLPWFTAAEIGGRGTLGCNITTPVAYVADLWELWGDGRRIVSTAERSLLLSELLVDHPRFPLSLGSVSLFARFIGYQAGVPLFEDMVAASDSERARRYGLKDAENDVFSLVRAYYERLSALGAVEQGCAASLLADIVPIGDIIVAERLDAAPAVDALIKCGRCLRFDDGSPAIVAESDQKSLFAFPAGMGAVAQSVLDVIEESPSQGHRVLVASKDPCGMFESCAPTLAQRSYETALSCSVDFDATAFGRALRAVEALMAPDAHDVQFATDFAYGAFSGMTDADARRLNSRLRGNRHLTAESAREMLSEASPAFAAFETILRGTENVADSFALLRDTLANAVGLPSEKRAAEERMLDAYAALRTCANELGIDDALMREQARGLRVPLSLASASYGPHSASVSFVGFDALAHASRDEFDTVVLVGLTDDEINTTSVHSTLDALAQRLGLPSYPSRTERLRDDFEHARRAASRTFACVMPLRDRAFEPTYPGFTLDEYAHAYARTVGSDDPVVDDDFFGFPTVLIEGSSSKGEDDLPSSVGEAKGRPTTDTVLEPVVRGSLKYTDMLGHLKTVDEAGEAVPVLSPSAIETYLACPYRWFATNRLRLSQPDETFSAREMGIFAHRVFKDLYEQLGQEGVRRIDEVDLDRAQAALDEAMDAVLAEYERTRDAVFEGTASDRLLAATPTEELEVAELRAALHDALALMAKLPEGFEVRGHEIDIAPESGIDFAGARLSGRIDRVDVSGDGERFAVIDYKGTLKGHAAGWSEDDTEEDFALPSKVQALIYALAYQRLQGGRPAAAVYASYRATEGDDLLAGSYDPVAYDAASSAGRGSDVWKDFSAFLELIEQRTVPAIDALKQGRIAPDPASADACEYCPVVACERRR